MTYHPFSCLPDYARGLLRELEVEMTIARASNADFKFVHESMLGEMTVGGVGALYCYVLPEIVIWRERARAMRPSVSDRRRSGRHQAQPVNEEKDPCGT